MLRYWICFFILAWTVNASYAQVKNNDQAISALQSQLMSSKAVDKTQYKYVRQAFAEYFRTTHQAEIRYAYGDKSKEIESWLNQNVELRDTLYAAIDPKVDQVLPALEVFRSLYDYDPKKLVEFPDLAVALAVTWDDPKAAYDYRGHQVRTRSLLPAEVLDVGAVENFKDLTSSSAEIQTMLKALPWEFLTHVSNHRTPMNEREWARKNYLKRRSGIGKIYTDIEYDVEMLRTQSQVCKLNGKPYTLDSILQHGGVCAMQADFAARVAKSLAVPAEYVRGEANSGGFHAWVMWVELRGVKNGKIDFVLASEGRYLGDRFYVGTLLDPKSGEWITDRDLERRLATIGQTPLQARHADLLMRSYDELRESRKFSHIQQLKYIESVLEIFPYTERAWLEVASMYQDGRIKEPAIAAQQATKLMTKFEQYPDFSWKLFPSILSVIKDTDALKRGYEKIVTSYEMVSRPDLACEARLVLANLQADAKDYKRAAEGLAKTIRKFPDEGRYIPKMMDKLEVVCRQYPGGVDLLSKFYLDLLPAIPATRGSEVSDYCVKMHKQALDYFTELKRPKEIELIQARLRKLGGSN